LQLIEIQALGITTSKQLGEAAEAAFLSKASGLGFASIQTLGRQPVLLTWWSLGCPYFDPRKKLRKSSEKVLDTDIA
jgi:hypothetical protein